jgi:phosphoribosyl 1,2-cyclic phosphodiesterase
MSLFVASLNSGSNGNCYYIGNGTEAVLIDAGISCRETERRLKRLELSIRRVKGIFITHEHTDHIYGAARLSRKFDLPVYVTHATLEQSRLKLRHHLVRHISAHEPVTIGSLVIAAFPIQHDARDPHNFMVTHGNINVGVFTDVGKACRQVVHHFRQCNAAFLEANYDETMLANGSYSPALKDRIRGGRGHLSNAQAAHLFQRHRAPYLSHLFLSHLSEENNTPDLVHDLFTRVANGTRVVVASRHEESAVYQVGPAAGQHLPRPSKKELSRLQLSLFQ